MKIFEQTGHFELVLVTNIRTLSKLTPIIVGVKTTVGKQEIVNYQTCSSVWVSRTTKSQTKYQSANMKAGGRQRTDLMHIVAQIRELTGLENAGETLRAALNSLTLVMPEWLRGQTSAAWVERYGRPFSDYRLPKESKEIVALADQIGQAGQQLLSAVDSTAPEWVRALPAVQPLRQVRRQQYEVDGETIHWRRVGHWTAAAEQICSP
jgi:hypothetical protein